MIKAIYVLKGNNGSLKGLSDLLTVIAGRTGCVPGCVSSETWINRETSEIMLMEAWRSMDDLKIHINSQLYKRLLGAIEMSSRKPKISFFDCDIVRGIDLIEEVMTIAGDSA